jgi:hypothetical protein
VIRGKEKTESYIGMAKLCLALPSEVLANPLDMIPQHKTYFLAAC